MVAVVREIKRIKAIRSGRSVVSVNNDTSAVCVQKEWSGEMKMKK